MKEPLRILFIDNFDSFTFNLVDDFQKRGAEVQVWRNNVDIEKASRLAMEMPPPRLIVLSPGPGGPKEAGCCIDLVRKVSGSVPLFGVCLGHQVLVEALGGTIGSAKRVVHGKSALVEHDGRGIFEGLPNPLLAGRYHSLIATEIGQQLRVSAWCDGMVMAVEHQKQPVIGLQFHPESILTPRGGQIVDRIISWASDWRLS